MDALRECPCCGKPGEMKTVYQRFRHGWIGCPACGLYMQWKNDPAAAVARWNTRKGGRTEKDLQRGCYNCDYSREGSPTMRCFGQKGAPAVRPTECCEAWKPAGSRE